MVWSVSSVKWKALDSRFLLVTLKDDAFHFAMTGNPGSFPQQLHALFLQHGIGVGEFSEASESFI